MNEIQKFEQEQIQRLSENKKIPTFGPGDTVRVNVKIAETVVAKDKKSKDEIRIRIQAYEGVCIARGGKGVNQSFTVRKISYGEGVERVFPLFSPSIDSIELVRRGSVRRAKLYYLRGLSGKAARIAERERDVVVEADAKAPAKDVAAPAAPAKKAAAAG